MESDEAKINRILEWAEDHEEFDTSFVEKLLDKVEKGYALTEGQSTALDNIIEKWSIE